MINTSGSGPVVQSKLTRSSNILQCILKVASGNIPVSFRTAYVSHVYPQICRYSSPHFCHGTPAGRYPYIIGNVRSKGRNITKLIYCFKSLLLFRISVMISQQPYFHICSIYCYPQDEQRRVFAALNHR